MNTLGKRVFKPNTFQQLIIEHFMVNQFSLRCLFSGGIFLLCIQNENSNFEFSVHGYLAIEGKGKSM